MKKLFIFIFIHIFSTLCFATPIVTGFGISYKTEISLARIELKQLGFNVISEKVIKDTNTDRIVIYVSSFEYDGIPYKNGCFSFDRELDGKYYFTISEGDVNTDLIDINPDYSQSYQYFLYKLQSNYNMEQSQFNENTILIYFEGSNRGGILLAISDSLHISYHPKGNFY